MAKFVAKAGKRVLLGGGKRIIFPASGVYETADKLEIEKLGNAKDVKVDKPIKQSKQAEQ